MYYCPHLLHFLQFGLLDPEEMCVFFPVLNLFNCTWMFYRCEMRWRISIGLNVLQDSQRASSLVHSSQQMFVIQRQFGRLWRGHSPILSQFSAVAYSVDWISEVVVDMAWFRLAQVFWYLVVSGQCISFIWQIVQEAPLPRRAQRVRRA